VSNLPESEVKEIESQKEKAAKHGAAKAEPLPGSKLWFQEIALEIQGVQKIEVYRVADGAIQLVILLKENGLVENIKDELSKRLSIKCLAIPFECELVFLKPVERSLLDRGKEII
jgi:hypothetical protein